VTFARTIDVVLGWHTQNGRGERLSMRNISRRSVTPFVPQGVPPGRVQTVRSATEGVPDIDMAF
jgi:hypothetical protein